MGSFFGSTPLRKAVIGWVEQPERKSKQFGLQDASEMRWYYFYCHPLISDTPLSNDCIVTFYEVALGRAKNLFDGRLPLRARSAQTAVKIFRWLVLASGRQILANKIPVGRPSEAFDQESAGHNWLLTSRSKILESGEISDFYSMSAVSTETHWITSWRKSRKQVRISQKVGWFDCKKKVYFSRSGLYYGVSRMSWVPPVDLHELGKYESH